MVIFLFKLVSAVFEIFRKNEARLGTVKTVTVYAFTDESLKIRTKDINIKHALSVSTIRVQS